MFARHFTMRGMFTFVCGAALCFSLASCLPLATLDPSEPFSMKLADSTISPFGPLRICFSYPLANPDSIGFVLLPPFAEFRQNRNATSDTLTLEFPLPLAGNARYALMCTTFVEADDGSLLRPRDDTLFFRTWPIEQEPNDAPDLADILHTKIFGSISTANDTDWFAIPDTATRFLYLVSKGSSSTFLLRDASGQTARPRAFAPAETLAIPSSFTPPLASAVFAFNRSNGGTYELGILRR